MKPQFDWKLAALIGVVFLVLYPIQQRLMFGTDSVFNGLLATGLTGALSAAIGLLAHRLLFGHKN